MLTIKLDYPPSVNHYWIHGTRNGRAIVYIGAKGRIYRETSYWVIKEALNGAAALTENVSLSVSLYPPDRRKRDVDNVLKCLLDTLTHANVWEDDSQVKHLEVVMNEYDKEKIGAYLEVRTINE